MRWPRAVCRAAPRRSSKIACSSWKAQQAFGQFYQFSASQLAELGAAGGGLLELAGGARKSPEHVRNALWTAHQLLDVGSAKVDKRVLIFTCDPNPPGTGVTANTNRRAPASACSPVCHAYPSSFTAMWPGAALDMQQPPAPSADRQRPSGLQ